MRRSDSQSLQGITDSGKDPVLLVEIGIDAGRVDCDLRIALADAFQSRAGGERCDHPQPRGLNPQLLQLTKQFDQFVAQSDLVEKQHHTGLGLDRIRQPRQAEFGAGQHLPGTLPEMQPSSKHWNRQQWNSAFNHSPVRAGEWRLHHIPAVWQPVPHRLVAEPASQFLHGCSVQSRGCPLMPQHGQPVGDQRMGRYHHPESLGHDAWLGSPLPYRDGSSYGSRSLTPVERFFIMVLPARLPSVVRRLIASMFCGLLVLTGLLINDAQAQAITAPELRGQRAVQDISADMHGRDLKEKEFLKADLREVNLSETDLRGAVINTSQLQGADLRGADLEDVVAFSSRFDGADLRDANFTNAMLMQSRFNDAEIEGTDFSNAVIDLTQIKALCSRASGVNSRSGLSTRETLGCR